MNTYHTTPLQLLGGLTAEQFFNEYWQKKPLLIRNAISDFESLITPDELAGLSLEEEVQSRIIIEKDGTSPWQVIYSPLKEEVFSKMPETHWTLLVSDVEKHIPEFTDITDQFRFIPDWCIDDLMISYAPEGGSVGPHIDQYDVFLLQAHGQRRWQISDTPLQNEDYIEGLDIRVLKEFSANHDWILNPGDMLYLPPRIVHHGVAQNHCMTYSMGFRANSRQELVQGFCDYIADTVSCERRFNKSELQDHPAEITASTLSHLKQLLISEIHLDNQHIEEWFGRFITEPKLDLALESDINGDIDDLFSELESGISILRHPAIRFAFTKNNNMANLYVNGEQYSVSSAFAESLCGERELDSETLLTSMTNKTERELFYTFFENGFFYYGD